MTEILKELGTSTSAPTLRSVRRMPNLKAALEEINQKAVGVDGIRWEGYRDPLAYLAWNPSLVVAYSELKPLAEVQESMAYGCIPDAVRPFRIQKRDLECGTVENRIRERAIGRKLVRHLDRQFAESSYGFRPKRSPETAILRARDTIRKGYYWALKTDIKKFFNNVRSEILQYFLQQVLTDEKLIEAIMMSVATVVADHGTSFQRTTGLPQGNCLAPTLSNLYLHLLDEACSGFQYFRYADDILVLCETREKAIDALRHILRVIGPLGLELNRYKTRMRDLHDDAVTFLGYELRGGNIHVPEESILKFGQKLKYFQQLRGQEARKGLMKSFADRFRFAHDARKLFRRLDRSLYRLYPPGACLVERYSRATEHSQGQGNSRHLAVVTLPDRLSCGLSCSFPGENTSGRPPHLVQQGAASQDEFAAPARKDNESEIVEVIP